MHRERDGFYCSIIDQTANISVITQIEALSWVNTDKAKEAIVKEFVSDSYIVMLTQSTVDECIKIRRSRKIKTPDAIIAATAIVNNFVLITSDNGFKSLQGLDVIDPQEM